jgi:hypothetical protein
MVISAGRVNVGMVLSLIVNSCDLFRVVGVVLVVHTPGDLNLTGTGVGSASVVCINGPTVQLQIGPRGTVVAVGGRTALCLPCTV